MIIQCQKQQHWIYKDIQQHMQVNEALCVNSDGIQTYQWCSYQSTDDLSIYVQYSYILVLTIYLSIIARYYAKLVQYRRNGYEHLFGDFFFEVFMFLFAWVLLSIVKTAINVAMYHAYMINDFNDPAPQTQINKQQFEYVSSTSSIVIFANIYNVCNLLTIFIILRLMILIPYRWITTALLSIVQKRVETKIQLRKSIERYFKIFKFVEIYYKYIRNLYIPYLFSQPFLLYFTNFGCSLLKYNYMIFIGQTALTLIIYAIGFYVSKFLRKNKLIIIKKSDYRKIRTQYMLLIFITMVRIAIIIFMRSHPLYTYQPNENCSDTYFPYKIEQLVFLTILNYVYHIPAITIIMFIYRPNVQYQEKRSNVILLGQSEAQQVEVQKQSPTKSRSKSKSPPKQKGKQKIGEQVKVKDQSQQNSINNPTQQDQQENEYQQALQQALIKKQKEQQVYKQQKRNKSAPKKIYKK